MLSPPGLPLPGAAPPLPATARLLARTPDATAGPPAPPAPPQLVQGARRGGMLSRPGRGRGGGWTTRAAKAWHPALAVEAVLLPPLLVLLLLPALLLLEPALLFCDIPGVLVP